MIFEFDALLFDLDGTLISSLGAVNRSWSAWAVRNGLDPKDVLPHIHGRKSIESIRVLMPHLDAELEDVWMRNREATDIEGIEPLPGAAEFLRRLECPWAIVTSGTSEVATARMGVTGLPRPTAAVYGEDVKLGKPHPEPFLMAAEKLGVDPARCVAFEDAVMGIRSAKAAEMKVVAVSTGLPADQLHEADAVIADYLTVALGPGNRIEIP